VVPDVCPGCGYYLVAVTDDYCPGCGLAFQEIPPAAVPREPGSPVVESDPEGQRSGGGLFWVAVALGVFCWLALGANWLGKRQYGEFAYGTGVGLLVIGFAVARRLRQQGRSSDPA